MIANIDELRSLELTAQRMTFYGQCGEDKHIYETYFKNKRDGVFLELGALDGLTYSNTKFFEESLGWTGVLIEPVPDYCSKIANHRPRSKVYNNIVSTSPEPMDIYVNGAVSSVKDYTTQQYFDGWHKGKNIKTIKVPSRRLDDILLDAGITHIDFWSLDVEGAEYEVLQTMDWSIPVGVICIEICGGESADMNEKCRQILRDNGFLCEGPVAHNEVWIHPDYKFDIARID
jgi:FkbM family methyltransferase